MLVKQKYKNWKKLSIAFASYKVEASERNVDTGIVAVIAQQLGKDGRNGML